MRIDVYASHLAEVQKELVKLVGKAAKYGIPFSFKVGEPFVKTLAVKALDPATQTWVHTMETVDVFAVPVEISDAMIRANGWTAVAKLEHFDNGNVVTMFDFGEEAPVEWRTLPPHCDHCGINRYRKETFMVRHESGEVRQVGSSCLLEYTGIDPRFAVLWAKVSEWSIDEEVTEDFRSCGYASECAYSPTTVIAFAADAIRKHGYVRSDEGGSTASKVKELLNHCPSPSEEGVAKAEKVVAWLKSLDLSVGGVVADVIPLAKQDVCAWKHIGRLAYMPLAYDRAMEKAKREAEQEARNAASDFVGTVGGKVEFVAVKAKMITSFPTVYGTTRVYKMEDASGNVFVWFSSGSVEVEDGVTVRGTVKEHKEYRGAKETVLTRCKIDASAVVAKKEEEARKAREAWMREHPDGKTDAEKAFEESFEEWFAC